MIPEGSKPLVNEAAAFNMAIATLMRLDKILLEYKNISGILAMSSDKSENINQATSLNVKIAMAKQFYLNAIPLIPNKYKADLKKELSELKLPIKEVLINSGEGKNRIQKVAAYDEGLNDRVDEFLIRVEEILQEEKYFMPPKNDPRMALRRE